jgi:hypothetical protein
MDAGEENLKDDDFTANFLPKKLKVYICPKQPSAVEVYRERGLLPSKLSTFSLRLKHLMRIFKTTI